MEVIPEAEIPKKQRKKKIMTEKMLLQLKDAREKALAVKKALKDDIPAKVNHKAEQIKKERKPSKKAVIKKLAEEKIAAEESDASVEPPETMEVKYEKKSGRFVDLASEKAISKIKEEEGQKTPKNQPEEEEVKLELAQPLPPPPPTPTPSPSSSESEYKKGRYKKSSFDSSSSSDDEDKIVYVPAFRRKKKAPKEKIAVNMSYQPHMPPSIVNARNQLGLFGSRSNYFR